MKQFIILILTHLLLYTANAQFTDSTSILLNTIEIKKENPANFIIQQASKNRKYLSPYANSSFRTKNYHYFIITPSQPTDSVIQQKIAELKKNSSEDSTTLTRNDSSLLQTHDFLQKQHLFLMESVSEHQFRHPALEHQKILAQQTSGIKDPIFTLFSTQIHNFTLYTNDKFEIFDTRYANPLASNSSHFYQFYIDSLISHKEDTLIQIQFQPKAHSHFTSLKGKIWISKQDYGIQKIFFQPYDTILNSDFTIIQEYERQNNGTWFPKSFSHTIQTPLIQITNYPINIIINSQLQFYDTQINLPLKRSDISFAEISIEENSNKTQMQLLNHYRMRPLDSMEINTYKLWDTIEKATQLNKKIFFIKTLTTGKIALGPINLDLNNIISYNNHEKLRLGISAQTNQKLSKIISIGGFFGYGIKDNKWKYGSNIDLTLLRSREFYLKLAFSSTLTETGELSFFDRDYTIFNGEFYRSFLIKNFDRRNSISTQIQGKITRWITIVAKANYHRYHTQFNYAFQHIDPLQSTFCFDQFSLSGGIRIAFKESLLNDPNFNFYRISPFPIIYLQYTRGINNILKSQYNYNRLDFKLAHKQFYKILGYTDIILHAGYVDRDLPYSLLFSPRAGYSLIGIASNEHFATMRLNEFACNGYIALFLRHNFGRMTQNKNFSPRIAIAQNIGWGFLSHPENHICPSHKIKGMEKGYYETGVIIEDLLVIQKLLAFGFGFYYRYGPESLPNSRDNFAFKIRFRVSLER